MSSQSLTFDNYVYPLINGSLQIANTNYNTNVPKSFALSVFHQDPKTIGLFKYNQSLENVDTSLNVITDYSGLLIVHVTNCASGNTNLNINSQTLTIYYDGNTYTGTVDSDSSISYKITNATSGSKRSDASGNFSATIYDVTHAGKLEMYTDPFLYQPASGVNLVTDGSGGIITIPLSALSGDIYLTQTQAVSISSYVTYVDPSSAI
jgi:hypothetical protein